MLMVVALHPYATLHTLPYQSHHSNESNAQVQTKPKGNEQTKKATSIVKKKASKEYKINKRETSISIYNSINECVNT